jgi:2-phospho-L-lactate guanylyltransferase (CobY/MobA/RfbA family)
MAAVVVPFRGPGAKSRLGGRAADLAAAMLADVLAAAEAVGPTTVARAGGGQGPAVAAELAQLPEAPVLVVNADLPCATPRDLLTLLGSTPSGGIALVEARDGTTNALALSSPRQFAPLYGAGSAERFKEHARRLGIECATVPIPNLLEDVDTVDDLVGLEARVGTHTTAALSTLLTAASA